MTFSGCSFFPFRSVSILDQHSVITGDRDVMFHRSNIFIHPCPVTQCARRTVKLEFSVFEPEFSMLITQMVYYGFEVICRELTIIAAVSIHG